MNGNNSLTGSLSEINSNLSEVTQSLNTFTDSGKVEQLHVGADGKPYIKYKVGADTVDLKLGSSPFLFQNLTCISGTDSAGAFNVVIFDRVDVSKYSKFTVLSGGLRTPITDENGKVHTLTANSLKLDGIKKLNFQLIARPSGINFSLE